MPATVKSKSASFGSAHRPDAVKHQLSNDELLQLYYFMRLTREFEESIITLYRQGKIIGGAFSGNGNEATAVGSAFV